MHSHCMSPLAAIDFRVQAEEPELLTRIALIVLVEAVILTLVCGALAHQKISSSFAFH